jgi:hypothetical protein
LVLDLAVLFVPVLPPLFERIAGDFEVEGIEEVAP